MKSLHRPLFFVFACAGVIWSGSASAGGQHRQQFRQQNPEQRIEQIEQVRKLKKVAVVLAYLRHKSESHVTLREVVKAKLVTKKVKAFLAEMGQQFEENDMDVKEVSTRLKLRILRYTATTADEVDEVDAENTFIEKLKSAAADRAGEEGFLQGVVEWTGKMLVRIETLKESAVDTDATPLLDKVQARIEGLKAQAEKLLAAQCTCENEASACVVRDWTGAFVSSAMLDQFGCDAIRCDTLARDTACQERF